ncbi:MAG TPA: DUF190 domain-containing protein [Gemmatimonadaceae bacterium]|nr:DUF190 domain-containing protein [Gemmatimonadaceae bacterium]
MHGLKGERVLMRIHIGERDKYNGEPLYWAIVSLLRERRLAGATVTRGIVSFGASSRIHAARFVDFSLDMPIVIECVDTEKKIDSVLPELDKMVTGGLITLERVEVITYRHHKAEQEIADDTAMRMTGSNPIT